jgi:hypothetical protein
VKVFWLRADQHAAPVPAAIACRRARSGLLIVAATVCVLVWEAGRNLGSELGITLTVVASVIFVFVPFLPWGFRARLHEADSRYLTAYTITGPRTVDLHQLARVHRLLAVGDGPGVDVLVLVDAAMRLGVFEAPKKRRMLWILRAVCAPLVLVPAALVVVVAVTYAISLL